MKSAPLCDRYTDRKLSALLHFAGMPQDEGSYRERWLPHVPEGYPPMSARGGGPRAFRLDELTETMSAKGITWWSMENRREDCTRKGREFAFRTSKTHYGSTAVEAAGKCLLDILNGNNKESE